MSVMIDILSYLVFTGFQFAALCMMTQGGRGWPWRVLALWVLIAADVLGEWWWHSVKMPFEQWLAVSFAVTWCLQTVLVVALSQDRLGRRLFLSIAWGAYAFGFGGLFHFFASRNVLGVSETLAVAAGLVVVAGLNLVLIFRILPLMPRVDRSFRWGTTCLAAFVMGATLYVCGFWPVSVLTAPARDCAAFWLMLVGTWVAFPSFCRTIRERQHAVAAERQLELMTAEMEVRRADIEEARRIRHDQRHNRIVICDFLLRGRTKEALEYLDELEKDVDRQPDLSQVWCENMTVNAILSGYARKAAAKGVGFTAVAHVERTAPLPDVELVAVVGNLVENAVEACGEKLRLGVEERNREKLKSGVEVEERNCPDFGSTVQPVDATSSSRQNKDVAFSDRRDGDVASTKERGHRSSTSTLNFNSSSPQVTVSLRQRGDTFGMSVTNPVPPDFRLSSAGLPCAVPGVGLGSVLRVIRKHAGDWRYTLENGVLTCEVRICGGL